jgi:carboxylesterase type B
VEQIASCGPGRLGCRLQKQPGLLTISPHFPLSFEPPREALGLFNQHGQPAYQYFFDAKLPNWIDYDVLGNYHTSELSLVFDNEWPPIVHDFDKDEKALSASFRLYWSNMARFGSPNHNLGPNQVNWPE